MVVLMPAAAPVWVVTFIALLKLAKETLIEITQAKALVPIYKLLLVRDKFLKIAAHPHRCFIACYYFCKDVM